MFHLTSHLNSTPDVYHLQSAKTVLRGTLRYKVWLATVESVVNRRQGFSESMQMMAKLGLFDEAPAAQLADGQQMTWATFVNSLAAKKGFLDVHAYMTETYGAEKGKEYLKKLQRLGSCLGP